LGVFHYRHWYILMRIIRLNWLCIVLFLLQFGCKAKDNPIASNSQSSTALQYRSLSIAIANIPVNLVDSTTSLSSSFKRDSNYRVYDTILSFSMSDVPARDTIHHLNFQNNDSISFSFFDSLSEQISMYFVDTITKVSFVVVIDPALSIAKKIIFIFDSVKDYNGEQNVSYSNYFGEKYNFTLTNVPYTILPDSSLSFLVVQSGYNNQLISFDYSEKDDYIQQPYNRGSNHFRRLLKTLSPGVNTEINITLNK
ncbi:MAG: hypothetical protein ACHQM6_03035, partial [Candidatus Kapaibacterium sp.]